uniref:Putative conserved secreted protein n=1 Tax=Culex tarsalis TaxID=7177 RepID=A0A1Q3EVB3_CULTA
MLKYAILAMLVTFGVTIILPAVRSSEEDILDLECTDDANCTTFQGPFHHSTCVNGSCFCTNPENGDPSQCVPQRFSYSNKIGGQCPCNSENSYCNETTQMCVCKDGFIPSREMKRCIKKSVPLNGTCEVDEQCIMHDSFSHCEDAFGNCTCLPHFLDFQDLCHSVVEGPHVNETTVSIPCEHDVDCSNHTANTSCHQGKCICVQGFVANTERNSCLPVVQYKGNCSESNQCIAQLGVGSVCSEGQCECSELFFPFSDHAHDNTTGQDSVVTTCKRKIVYGSTCNENKDCYQFHQGPHEQTLECFKSECVCKDTHRESEGLCLPRASSSTANIPSILLAFATLVFTLSRK